MRAFGPGVAFAEMGVKEGGSIASGFQSAIEIGQVGTEVFEFCVAYNQSGNSAEKGDR
jgi:hypothetical protein